MPKGHEHDPLYSLSIRNIANLFREKSDHYYILTRHNVFLFLLFLSITILLFILYENFKKKCPERRALILSEYNYRNVLIPKIFLKCNLFNMGAVFYFFFPFTILLFKKTYYTKTLRKMPRKARVNTKRIHRNVLMPPWASQKYFLNVTYSIWVP